MKALVKRERQEGLWLEDVPIPHVGDEDVLIKVKKARSVEQTSISGSGMLGPKKPFPSPWLSAMSSWVSSSRSAVT